MSYICSDVNAIRAKVSLESLNNEDLFNEIDVFRVRTDDWQIQRFLKSFTNEESFVKALTMTMVWKNKFGVYDRTDEYFPRECFEFGDPEIFGKDREDRVLVWGNVRYGSPPIVNQDYFNLFKQLMVHYLEKIDKLCHKKRCTQVTCLSNTGSLGIDFSLNGLQVFNMLFHAMRDYFPLMMKRNLLVDTPRVQWALAKVIVGIANKSVKRMDLDLRFITRKELTEFVDWDLIPAEMGGPRIANIVVPDNVRPLKELKHFKFSDKEFKKLEEHSNKTKERIKKLKDEYKLSYNKFGNNI